MRIHLFEWEDQRWFPNMLRNNMTDFLRNVIFWQKIYAPAVDILQKILKVTGHTKIIDLCSGAGGGIEVIAEELNLNNNIKFILTDKFPNNEAISYFKNSEFIDYHDYPVDATWVPGELPGLRTLFSSFHHFKYNAAENILKDAVKNNMPIAVFEGAGKTVIEFVSFLILFPFLIFLITPFLKPFKWNRIFFTYLIPLLPFFIYWDGLVSILRMYSIDDLKKLTKSFENDYVWNIGKIKGKVATVTYLTGIPLR